MTQQWRSLVQHAASRRPMMIPVDTPSPYEQWRRHAIHLMWLARATAQWCKAVMDYLIEKPELNADDRTDLWAVAITMDNLREEWGR